MLLNRFLSCFLEAEVDAQIEQQSEQVQDTVDKTVNEVTDMFNNIKQFIVEQGISIVLKLLFVIIIYVVAKKLKKIIVNMIDRALKRSTMEESVAHFVVRVCESFFSFVIIIAIVGYLGIDTSSLVALVGSAGLAVGLALQGSLSNFAGGVLILIMKPFMIGDYIVVSGVEGVVTGIDIFYTKLTTVDNRTIVIPNGSLSNANIENVSSMPYRRIDLFIPVEYSADIKLVKDTLNQIANDNENVLQDSEEHMPVVFVNSFEDSSISMGFRVWVETADYWTTKWALMENVKTVFDEKGINIPFSRMDVSIISDKVDK